MKYSISTLFLFFVYLSPVQGYFFRNYQVEDGLSHNCVWTVMQDDRGIMWFGTIDGLNRFDGKSIKIYRKRQGDTLSIGNNFIHYLKEDSRGRFFVGTKQGLYLFNIETETFSHVSLNGKKWGEDDTSINYMMEDPDGNLWIACYGQGLYILNPDLTVKKYYCSDQKESLPSNNLWTMVQDYNGVIWIGTEGMGLVRFDPNEERFTVISQDENPELADPTIYSLYCDMDNNIWIGTSVSGLYRYSQRTGKMAEYMNQSGKKILNIKSIIEMSDHELIMGSDKGLVRFDKNNETYYLMNDEASFDNITDKSIFSIVKDKENNFWIATYFGGVNYFSPEINKFSYYSGFYRLSSGRSIISSFAEDEYGRIWIGTNNKGLSLFNPKTSMFEQIEQKLGYHDIQKMMLDYDELWISLYGQGVSVLDIKNNSIKGSYTCLPQKENTLVNNIVNTIFKTSKGVIILGSSEGANYIDPADKKVREYKRLSGIPIKDITEDYNGAIWFAAHMHGLLRLSADGTWDSFAHRPGDSTSLVGNNVNCVFQDARYRIWVGTEGEGLTLFNPKENRFEYILNEKNGLPSNIVYSIVEDADGNIWASTGGGLVRIDSKTMNIRTFRYAEDLFKIRYNRNCGVRASDNRLYFGGTNGFISFNPKDITENLSIPSVIITGFQIFGKDIMPGDDLSPLKASVTNTEKITLKHSQSTFSFDFVSLSYVSPAQNRYAYMLEGFDNEWHYTDNTNNKAVYMNIPSGKYIFKVKGTNSSGIWNEKGSRIVIHIKPPFWLSGMMLAFYVILVFSLLFFIIRQYNRRLVAKNNEKLYKYTTEKEKEVYESKIGFFTNIAHEIRTPLSLIVAPLENIIVSGDGSYQTKMNLDIIKRNTNRLLELVNQLLDFRKIEEDMFRFNFKKEHVSEIVRDVYKQYADHAKIRNISVEFPENPENIVCVVDAEAIYKIVSNLMSNAIKYARQKVRIDIKTKNNKLLIMVEDDGSGMDSSYLKRIFEPFFQIDTHDSVVRAGSGLGLSLSQSLAVKHGGNISVKSEQDKGTVFTLCIPVVLTEDVIQEESLSPETKKEAHNESDQPDRISDSDLKPNILLVEDNKELRTFLRDSLNSGFIVFEAENGLEALDIVEKENIGIIITDILMPDMDGLELCHRLKTNPDYSYIPVIVLSAKTDISTKVEGLNTGADVYMEKPFSLEQLKAQINSVIENRNHIRDNFIKSPLQYYKQKPENTENAEFIEKLNAIILEYIMDENFSIDHLLGKFGMSRSNFHKKMKNITGMTPNDYIKLIRLNQSAQLLATSRYKVNEVCYMVGFNTPSYFSKCFYEQFGKLPKDFIQND